ncbi:MAG: pyridoxamine 5'-phosphate oxidase family protein [Prevotella sp.]|nr:pyridoxamine 5'-phosphate oxidase family protein [Prevotella sp.]MBQ4173272.1 pyridoxamine 5'-phosphate oxidase family protein [Prevotella sp.]
MKKVLLAFAVLLGLVACTANKATSAEKSVVSSEVPFTVAEHYFFNKGQDIPVNPKITSEELFKQLFGMATVMGENGKPTEIDFSKQFVLAVVLPVTDINTEITPVKVEEKGDTLFYHYDVKTGEKQSFSIQPLSIIILDKKYENKEIFLINQQAMEENMKEVQAYLKECGAFFIATVDGDQPRVRAFGVSEIIDGRLYIMTGKVKDVFKQMAANGKFEICALKPSGSEWMRVSGTLVNDETLSVKETFLERNPSLKAMYKADDDNMAVLYITNGVARFCSFAAPERKVAF